MSTGSRHKLTIIAESMQWTLSDHYCLQHRTHSDHLLLTTDRTLTDHCCLQQIGHSLTIIAWNRQWTHWPLLLTTDSGHTDHCCLQQTVDTHTDHCCLQQTVDTHWPLLLTTDSGHTHWPLLLTTDSGHTLTTVTGCDCPRPSGQWTPVTHSAGQGEADSDQSAGPTQTAQ